MTSKALSEDFWKGRESEFAVSNASLRLVKEKFLLDFFWVPQFSFLDHLKVDFIFLIKADPFLVPLQVKSSYFGLVEHKSKLISGEQKGKIEGIKGRIYLADDRNLIELTKEMIVENSGRILISVYGLNAGCNCSLAELADKAENEKKIFLIIGDEWYELTQGLLLNIPAICVFRNDSIRDLCSKIKKVIKNYCSLN
jgi:hypothetical protein